ncbi:MAG: hypothetical protein ACLQI7_22400 [Streptosporangiaceae bacterium]
MTFVHHAQESAGRESAPRGRRTALRLAAAVVAAGALVGGVAAAPPASASTTPAATSYHFRTINNSNDETFNQLLGINSKDKIAGYFGSGAAGHKNKGYTLLPPYRQSDFRTENFPHSAQTQVTGLNDKGVTVGFWSHTNKASMVNANFGFYAIGGRHFRSVNFPTSNNSAPPVNQLLGVNNSDIAVGFYTDSKGNSHGYTYNIRTRRFHRVTVRGATSLTAAAINSKGSIAGFLTNSKGVTKAFFLRHNGQLITFGKTGASMTQAFGVNDFGEVVGAYTVGTGSSAKSFGFTWTLQHGFRTVNDPKGVGATVVNGVNDAGDLVGFYTGAHGNVNGMLATP